MVSAFIVTDRPVRSRGSSVITEELLHDLVGGLKDLQPGKEILLTAFPRASKASAASLAFQVRRALAARDVHVHGGARPEKPGQAADKRPWFAALSN